MSFDLAKSGDFSVMSVEALTTVARECHEQAIRSAEGAAQAAIKSGLALLAIKGKVGHGKWESWLESEGWSTRTAQRYMQLASGFDSKAPRVALLPKTVRGALAAISPPSESKATPKKKPKKEEPQDAEFTVKAAPAAPPPVVPVVKPVDPEPPEEGGEEPIPREVLNKAAAAGPPPAADDDYDRPISLDTPDEDDKPEITLRELWTRLRALMVRVDKGSQVLMDMHDEGAFLLSQAKCFLAGQVRGSERVALGATENELAAIVGGLTRTSNVFVPQCRTPVKRLGPILDRTGAA